MANEAHAGGVLSSTKYYGNHTGVFVKKYNGGDSAIAEFYDAVMWLNNNAGDESGGLILAGSNFNDIGSELSSANSRLASGWYQAGDLIKQIDNKLQLLLSNLILEMNRYAENVDSEEQKAISAVENSNNTTNDILNELNGI